MPTSCPICKGLPSGLNTGVLVIGIGSSTSRSDAITVPVAIYTGKRRSTKPICGSWIEGKRIGVTGIVVHDGIFAEGWEIAESSLHPTIQRKEIILCDLAPPAHRMGGASAGSRVKDDDLIGTRRGAGDFVA